MMAGCRGRVVGWLLSVQGGSMLTKRLATLSPSMLTRESRDSPSPTEVACRPFTKTGLKARKRINKSTV
ncbi:hypothetical protein Pcinc_030931 [Petrolisthes cinctipes]|uniref:Uncharacterized protein n=1 Tax=Petrolisthes cinctipes TaxID=88211 RepID=A0AAE1K3F0_PETCI|nr:hypothetical protein Pcinc_030931 [Petrolisthes cinctipes]